MAYTPPSYNPRKTPQKARKESWRYEQPPTLTERLLRALVWCLTMLITLLAYLWRELWVSPWDKIRNEPNLDTGGYPSPVQLIVWMVCFGVALLLISRLFTY